MIGIGRYGFNARARGSGANWAWTGRAVSESRILRRAKLGRNRDSNASGGFRVVDAPKQLIDHFSHERGQVDVDHGRVVFEVVVNEGVVVADDRFEIAIGLKACLPESAEEGTGKVINGDIQPGGSGFERGQALDERLSFRIQRGDFEVADIGFVFAQD